jgi:hypothetical protein
MIFLKMCVFLDCYLHLAFLAVSPYTFHHRVTGFILQVLKFSHHYHSTNAQY